MQENEKALIWFFVLCCYAHLFFQPEPAQEESLSGDFLGKY